MLSLMELRRAAAILDRRLPGARLRRILPLDRFRLLLIFHASVGDLCILLSCHPDFARISLLTQVPAATPFPLSLAEYLGARLVRSRCLGVRIPEDDRQARISLATQTGSFELILSILGARSNIYLLDAQSRLIHSMRPLRETRRELEIGSPWSCPSGKLRTRGEDRWKEVADELYLETIESTYDRLERRREAEVLARRIETALAKEMDSLERKAGNILDDLAEARSADVHRKRGELLKSVLHEIRHGQSEISATDFETGESITLPLDPTLTPAQNLEACFARYQKVSRGVPMLERHIEEVRAAQEGVEKAQALLHRLLVEPELDMEALENLARQPFVRKPLSRHYPSRQAEPRPAAAQSKKKIPSRILPKRYRTEEGMEIWVGRNDEGNDYLTTRLAKGNDLFFHLDGYPGSHVILRTEGREAPSESVLAACELAVHFSQLKNATRADVHVAAAKNVRKPKGAKPGLVYVTKGKTIHLRRNPKRLENVLASRIED